MSMLDESRPSRVVGLANLPPDKSPVDICRILQVLKEDEMLQVEYLKNTGDKNFAKRPWSTDSSKEKELIHISSVLCVVHLDSSGALEQESILEMIKYKAEFPGQRRKKGGILIKQSLQRILLELSG